MTSQQVSGSANRKKILVVDDEPTITRALRASFLANGYDVRTAHDGIAGLNVLEDWRPDLQENVESKIRALDAGADDYVTKPFSIDELLARVRTALRRLELVRSLTSSIPANEEILHVGDFTINILNRQVTIQERDVRLTPKEYDLLLFFLRNADRVLTHSAIITSIWGAHSTHQPEYLRVLVAALRKKIEPDPLHPQYLITDPWVGYRLTPSEEEVQ
jgi:two-component system, OmpR family, KDP operon response regulator KdpE